MLDQETIKIIKATIPILVEHGEALTQHFYKRMFKHNPEVVSLFNQANQANGSQQKALAGAICEFAANIDNISALADAVELIANKHASLQIKPEHYPIVGANLIASIMEVLKVSASSEIIVAWGKAYHFLAGILHSREEQIYDDTKNKFGGWLGFKNFIVAQKTIESSLITSFYLKPKDGSVLPMYSAGQYITIRLPTQDGSTTMRNYSLSDKPGQDYFRISVKREQRFDSAIPDGYVSNKLHHDINVGDVLEVGPPCGNFFLNLQASPAIPLVFLAAGIGITPIMSMLLTALDHMPNHKIIFIHACLNEQVQAFKGMLDQLSKEHNNLSVHYIYSDAEVDVHSKATNSSKGFVNGTLLDSVLPSRHANYYFCGPKAFMVNIYQQLTNWGIAKANMHFEFFGPKQELVINNTSY